jgi:hypothetical protein
MPAWLPAGLVTLVALLLVGLAVWRLAVALWRVGRQIRASLTVWPTSPPGGWPNRVAPDASTAWGRARPTFEGAVLLFAAGAVVQWARLLLLPLAR